MPNPALWTKRKLFSTAYVKNQKIVVDLLKYETVGTFDRIVVKLTGAINTGSATAGTGNGLDNPESLLTNATLNTTPVVGSLLPINQVSGRTLKWDRAMDARCVRGNKVITDAGGSEAVDIEWHLIFKRKGVRKGIEYAFDIGRYTGAILNLTFGDQSTLFTGSSNVWDFSGCTVEIWGNIEYNVNPKQIHATELFEQVFPVTATQTGYLINQLPQGCLYDTLVLLAEDNGALANTIITNIDLEGGGRIWLPMGESNADEIERDFTLNSFDGSVVNSDDPAKETNSPLTTGVYILQSLRSGMYSRAVDALTSQILIKPDVVFTSGHIENMRLFGRKLLPGAVYKAPATKSA